MSVSSHGDSVSETSGSNDTSVVHVRDNSSGVTVERLGLSLPLAVDVGMISGISDNTVVDTSVVHVRGNSGDVSVEGLGLSLPLSVVEGMVDSSVREASYSSNTGIADTSDNTTSSAPSQHLSDGVGIRLAADGYSQEHS